MGVEGAEPGDLLVVDILDIGAFSNSLWVLTVFLQENGGGFLTEHFPEAQKSIWDFNGMFTSSRHVPGVEFAGLIHPGLIGCLPSKKCSLSGTRGEKALFDTEPERTPPLAALPYAETAHMGKLKAMPPKRPPPKALDRAAAGARRQLRY